MKEELKNKLIGSVSEPKLKMRYCCTTALLRGRTEYGCGGQSIFDIVANANLIEKKLFFNKGFGN